jgi:hypothetical protein
LRGGTIPSLRLALKTGREARRRDFSLAGPRLSFPDGFFGWMASFLTARPLILLGLLFF